MPRDTLSRSIQKNYSARLFIIDYGLKEKTIHGISHGLDQFSSLMNTYIGITRVPAFGLLVNGQYHSEIFLSLSIIPQNPMEVQVALYKIQLLAQKWSTKSNRISTLPSWNAPLQLAYQEIQRFSTTSPTHHVQIVICTNQILESNVNEIERFLQTYSSISCNIEVICMDENQNQSIETLTKSFDWLNAKIIPDNKYSTALYFKSWLKHDDHDSEHLRLIIPSIGKGSSESTVHIILCDLQNILLDPYYHVDHDRFFIFTEPRKTMSSLKNQSLISLPIYQLKAMSFIKQNNCCVSLVFGMPLLITPTTCKKLDENSTAKNSLAFHTLTEYLRKNELMIICRLQSSPSATTKETFTGHFLISLASENTLLLRSVASSELLLPFNKPATQIKSDANSGFDQALNESLMQLNVEPEEYNPLYYDARQSRISLNVDLI